METFSNTVLERMLAPNQTDPEILFNYLEPSDLADLAREALAYRKDLEDAAGELLIPLPEPGSDMAKMMTANALLRRRSQDVLSEKAGLEALCAVAEKVADAAGDVFYGYPCLEIPDRVRDALHRALTEWRLLKIRESK
jgi:hypothetical protein